MSIVQPLLILQEIDTRIRALQQEARDIPLRKEQEKKRLVGAQEALVEAQTGLKNAQARVNEAELEVKDRREKINKLRGQQATLKTNKEFAAMNLEIATIEGQIDTLESRQVVAMDTVATARIRPGPDASGNLPGASPSERRHPRPARPHQLGQRRQGVLRVDTVADRARRPVYRTA